MKIFALLVLVVSAAACGDDDSSPLQKLVTPDGGALAPGCYTVGDGGALQPAKTCTGWR